MGDPLSVAATVAGLISLGVQSTEYLYKYYSACRDQHKELDRIADQLGGLLESLQLIDENIRNRTWRHDEERTVRSIEKAITRSEEIINVLQDEVNKFKKEPTSSRKKKVILIGRRAMYPFKRSTIEDIADDVDTFRDNLSVALQALQLKEHQNTQSDIEEMRRIVECAQAQHVATGLRQWLRAPDATSDYNNASRKRHAVTGQWLTQSSAFLNWLHRDNSFLWLYGFAGCGKSVICSTAIQHTFCYQRAQSSNSAIAFFFFTFNNNSKQDDSAVLRSLLLQLAGQIDGFEVGLTRLQNTLPNGTPLVSTLVEYLRDAITRCEHAFILLDALDESPEGATRADVLSMIETMREWNLSGLHLLVTSRDASDIRSCMEAQRETGNVAWVPMRNNSVDRDIQDYVAYQVDHDRELRRWDETCRQQIKDYLSQHAAGVFRWVQCQLDPLKRCPRSVKHLERCLRTLPQSLDQTYERMLDSIGEESRDDAQQMLSLLCYSPRPLSVDEVIEALAVDVDDQERYDQDRRLAGADDLLRICPGLIEIRPVRGSGGRSNSTKDNDDQEDADQKYKKFNKDSTRYIDMVRVGHFSVQEYLMSDRIKRGSAAEFALTGSKQHAQICKMCLLYLSDENFLGQPFGPQLMEDHCFAQYAAQNWPHHYRQAGPEFVHSLSNQAASLLLRENIPEHWARVWNPEGPWGRPWSIPSYEKYPPNFTSPAYYAATLGLDHVLAKILKEGANVNASVGNRGNALTVASVHGHESVVQTLIDAGADVSAQPNEAGTIPLIAAVSRGFENVVRILLNAGVDVDAQNSFHGFTALTWAVRKGYEQIVRMLLDAEADVEVQSWLHGCTALMKAASQGSENMVRMLLDAEADVNTQSKVTGHTALIYAARKGHENIVGILLAAGADVNIIDAFGCTALDAALKCGHERVQQILIDAGAKAEIPMTWTLQIITSGA